MTEIVEDNRLIEPQSKVYNGAGGSPDLANDVNLMNTKSKKKPVQITWEDITITAHPPKAGMCGKKNAPQAPPKEIIRGVSGTVMPGQFLAIIGASGKSHLLFKIECFKQVPSLYNFYKPVLFLIKSSL